MSHILIRWVLENELDVYPTFALENREMSARITTDVDAIVPLRGSLVMVKTSGEDEPGEAVLIDAGPEEAMEKRRVQLILEAALESQAHQQDAACCHHKDEAERLQSENKRLGEENERLSQKLVSTKRRLMGVKELLDCSNMAKDLRTGLKYLRTMNSDQSPERVCPGSLVDIGNNVIVDGMALQRVRDSKKSPGSFARALLGLVFSKHELKGRSLTGRRSNAFPDTEAKEALDQTRVDAVVAYTVKEYGNVETQVRMSLSSYLSKNR